MTFFLYCIGLHASPSGIPSQTEGLADFLNFFWHKTGWILWEDLSEVLGVGLFEKKSPILDFLQGNFCHFNLSKLTQFWLKNCQNCLVKSQEIDIFSKSPHSPNFWLVFPYQLTNFGTEKVEWVSQTIFCLGIPNGEVCLLFYWFKAWPYWLQV